MKLSTALVACLAALSWTPAQIEAYGFVAGSSFRHAVNNLRPEVQRTNRNAMLGAMRDTFKTPADIPTNKLSAIGTGVQFGGNLHKHGWGSQGMGNWRFDEDEDEMNDEDENEDDDFARQLLQRRGNRRLSLQQKFLDTCENRCKMSIFKKQYIRCKENCVLRAVNIQN